MADPANPWADLIAAATAQIREANEGNALAAHEVLRQATVGLREVLAGRLPDPERLEYLRYLVGALEQIAQDVPPDKALGVWSGQRPHSVSEDRDFVLFVAVGTEIDRLRSVAPETDAPVGRAIQAVAVRYSLGPETIRKAWTRCGGEKDWMAAKEPLGEISPQS